MNSESRNCSLYQVVCLFSDEIGVERPKTNDLGVWWRQALQQMDKHWIDFLSQNFGNSTNWVLQRMKQALEQRKQELELSTLS